MSIRWSADELNRALSEGRVKVAEGARIVKLLGPDLPTGRPPKEKKPKIEIPVFGPPPKRKKKPVENLEERLAQQLQAAGIVCERQYAWLEGRKYRADFAHVPSRTLIELDGAVHRIKSRFAADIRKSQDAICNGWRLLRIATTQVRQGTAVQIVRRAIDK